MIKVRFLATEQSPEKYSFDGETITAYIGNQSDNFNLSNLQQGDRFEGVESTLDIHQHHIIRNVVRDQDGILWVTLCQQVGAGIWSESEWFDADEYEVGKKYVREGVSDWET